MELRVEKQVSVSLRVPVDYVSLTSSTVLQFEFPECTYKLAYRSLMFQINHI